MDFMSLMFGFSGKDSPVVSSFSPFANRFPYVLFFFSSA